jgi:fatty acid desaturase
MGPTAERVILREPPGLAPEVKRELLALMRPSDMHGLYVLIRNWLGIILVACASIEISNVFVYLAAIWLIGAFQYCLGEVAIHAATHKTLFKTKRLNDALEVFYGIPFFQTVSQYRMEHKFHHTDTLGRQDSRTEYYNELGLNRPGCNMLWVCALRPILGHGVISNIKSMMLMPAWSSLDRVKIMTFWTSAVIIGWFTGTLDLIVLYWIVPFIWCYGSFLYWSEISDHFNTESGVRTRAGWLYNRFFHNDGYHHVHHTDAAIPLANMPRAHALLYPACPDISHGLLETFRQVAARPRKNWPRLNDEQSVQMLGQDSMTRPEAA